MNEQSALMIKQSPPASWRHFVRHFVEMLVAMIVGMAVLGPVWVGLLTLLGCASVLEHAEVHALVMATDMTIGMSLWMRYRGHGWASIREMAAAMYLPFVVLFGPLWAGLISAETMLAAGHMLMLPAMLIAMLYRRDEYKQHHRQHRHRRSALSGVR
jgi:hypothetical protein